MKRNLYIALSAALVLGACASTPDYSEARSETSSGYSETQLEENRYLVRYLIRDDDIEEARLLAMRRAAELTLINGYATFELVSQIGHSERDRDLRSGAGAYHPVTTRSCGLLGCQTSVHGAAGYGTGYISEREESTVELEIIMSDLDPNVSPSLYSASEVYSNTEDL